MRESRAARAPFLSAAILGITEAGLIVVQAVLLAAVIARAAAGGAEVFALRGELAALAAVLAGRALVSAGFLLSGRMGATRVMSELRGRLVSHVLLRAPGQRPADVRTGELAASAVQGVEALEAYFAGYLPQLVLACVVPTVVLAWVAHTDPITAVILALTIPILVGFMVLIGHGTRAQARRRIGVLELLSAHFLDVLRGLETLRAYRRDQIQETALTAVGDRYRHETMATLRLAFLSALVLELCAMLGTALVAATIGVQLVGGRLGLESGLTVLLLAPELYGPLRRVGQQFHAGADGTAAVERIFATLAQPAVGARARHTPPIPDPGHHSIALRGVSYEYPGRPGFVLDDLDLTFEPGVMTALVGESGSGKSTVARLLLGFADPTRGSVTCGGHDLREFDIDAWRSQMAWVPQHPTLFTGTIAENIAPGATPRAAPGLESAIRAAGLTDVIAALPDRLDTLIGDGGRRLSAGQRQRVALARAFLRAAPLLVLDEPTAHLDRESAASVHASIERLAAGRTTLLIVHDESLAQRADRILRMEAGRIIGGPVPTMDLRAA